MQFELIAATLSALATAVAAASSSKVFEALLEVPSSAPIPGEPEKALNATVSTATIKQIQKPCDVM